jgi:hypothetical protein
MKKFKTIFLVTLIINVLAVLPLFLMPLMPSIKEELIYSQFEGMADNALANEIWDLFNSVVAFMAASILVVNAMGVKSKSLESARTTALILLVLLIGFTLPDWLNFFQGAGHPPLLIMVLNLIPLFLLEYGRRNAEL